MSMFPVPSVAEERAEAMHRLLPGAPVERSWKHNGTILSIVFAVLALIATLAFFGFFAIPFGKQAGWPTAIAAIGTSEWLIRKSRFFGTGVESSLWLYGLFAMIVTLPSSGKIEAILVFAAAAALAGWRMRNAFFGVLATVLVLAYLAAKWDKESVLVIAIASVISLAAMFALRRQWQRPSTERLFAGLALVMPVAGYAATIAQRIFGSTFPTSFPVAFVLGMTAMLMLACGIAWRDRILLVSGALSAVLAVAELHDLFSFPAEARLIAAGVVLTGIATTLARLLRGETRGFVVTPVRHSAYEEAMQLGGVIAVAPHGSAPAVHSHTGPELADSSSATDKSFGGAGSGGGF